MAVSFKYRGTWRIAYSARGHIIWSKRAPCHLLGRPGAGGPLPQRPLVLRTPSRLVSIMMVRMARAPTRGFAARAVSRRPGFMLWGTPLERQLALLACH